MHGGLKGSIDENTLMHQRISRALIISVLLLLFRFELWHEQCCVTGLKLHMGCSTAKIDDSTWCPHRSGYWLQLKSAPQLHRFWNKLQCEEVITHTTVWAHLMLHHNSVTVLYILWDWDIWNSILPVVLYVKCGVLHWGKNVNYKCLKTSRSRTYLDLWGMK